MGHPSRLPSLPVYLTTLAVLILLAGAAIVTPTDPDLWGHLTFGRDIVESATPIQVDTYSFTSDRPWINHEWLAEVTSFTAYRAGGPVGLILFKLAMILAMLGVVAWHCHRAGVSGRALAVLLGLAFLGTYWRTHAVRPQLFSVVCFAILLAAIARADTGRRRVLLAIPIVMALWANSHGGWIVGLGVLGLWTTFRILDPRLPWHARLFTAVAGLASVAATLLTPFGLGLWRFILETVRLGRSDIEEWGSVLTYPLALGVTWSIGAGVAGLTVWRLRGRVPPAYLAIVVLLGIASFQVSRLDAFFALAAVILLGPALVQTFLRHETTTPQTAAPRGAFIVAIVTTVAMVVPAAMVLAPSATCLPVFGSWVPDREAGVFLQERALHGRLLSWFDWGEYAIWHFGPALQVSFDGRRETVYTERTIVAHHRFYQAQDEGKTPLLTALNPDYIWLPKRLPVTSQLAARGWRVIFDGPVSVVFARGDAGNSGPAPVVVSTAAVGRRCFPGP